MAPVSVRLRRWLDYHGRLDGRGMYASERYPWAAKTLNSMVAGARAVTFAFPVDIPSVPLSWSLPSIPRRRSIEPSDDVESPAGVEAPDVVELPRGVDAPAKIDTPRKGEPSYGRDQERVSIGRKLDMLSSSQEGLQKLTTVVDRLSREIAEIGRADHRSELDPLRDQLLHLTAVVDGLSREVREMKSADSGDTGQLTDAVERHFAQIEVQLARLSHAFESVEERSDQAVERELSRFSELMKETESLQVHNYALWHTFISERQPVYPMANLAGAHLEGADLSGAALLGTTFSGAHLDGAMLRGTHLEQADLADAHLERADLAGAHLSGADLQGAHLEGADLTGVQGLTEAQVRAAYIDSETKLPAYLPRAVDGGDGLPSRGYEDDWIERPA